MAITPAQRWTIVLLQQGAITLPGPSDSVQTGTVQLTVAAGTGFTCYGSSPFVQPTVSYDTIAKLLTVKGAPGDTVAWQAWTLTAAP